LVGFPISCCQRKLTEFVVVASLCQKYQKAKAAVETMNSAVEGLTKSIGNKHWITEWKKLEEVAKVERGEALMIYNVSNAPGVYSTLGWFQFITHRMGSSITITETAGSHEDQ